jgi:AraC family transcriptional regulator
MHLQTVGSGSTLPVAIPDHPLSSGRNNDGHRFCAEKSWRCLADTENDEAIDADILVSRWSDTRSSCRHEHAELSSPRHVIGVSLKATQVTLARGSSTVFDGPMAAGTLHITRPGQPLTAEFRAPCDFVHFHVSSDYLRECQTAARSTHAQPIPDLNDLVVRDPLAELLGRTLIEGGMASDDVYVKSVGQTLVMHVARLEPPRNGVNALPKWRLKRIQEYVGTHLETNIRLADLAMVAGLSRMHFAAQFRAATGHRPHEYVLHQRIECAKDIMTSSDMPLAEVALTVGFQAQAHFSTVFKRLTDETPARWRAARRQSDAPSANRCNHVRAPARFLS